MDWLYEGKEVLSLEDMPQNYHGFIYEVTHIPSGKKYIGKKSLHSVRNIKLGKKEAALLKEQRKSQGLRGATPKKKQVIKESDWKTYYGSQAEIKKLVKEGKGFDFERKILTFVPNKKLLTYYECKYLFINEVLENRNNYINDNILGKFYKKDFINDKN